MMHVIRGRIDLGDLRISEVEDTVICGLIRNCDIMVPEGRCIVLNFPCAPSVLDSLSASLYLRSLSYYWKSLVCSL